MSLSEVGAYALLVGCVVVLAALVLTKGTARVCLAGTGAILVEINALLHTVQTHDSTHMLVVIGLMLLTILAVLLAIRKRRTK